MHWRVNFYNCLGGAIAKLYVSSYIIYLCYHNSYIYNEFDLIDNLLLFDREKSLIVLDYLKKINLPEPYLLAILYNEIKKIFFLKNNLEPKPYIPYNKSALYQKISSKLNSQKIKKMMKYCYKIDKSIKSSSNNDYVWNQFECIIHSFN